MQTAFVDESQIGGTGSGLPYLLTASFAFGVDVDDVRDVLRGLLPRGARKLHWREATDAKRAEIISALASLELIHIVIVRDRTESETPERSRRACMEMLLYELGMMEVDHAVFESRGPSDSRDLHMVSALRARKVLLRPMRVDHMPGPSEPLLWIPDVVNGAVGAALGGGAHGLEHQAWVRSTNQGY